MRRLALLGLLLLPPALSACRMQASAAPFAPDEARAREKELVARLRRHPEDVDARRELGHLRWMQLGETAEAVALFEPLAREGDPAAQFAMVVIAHGHVELETVWKHGTELLASAAGDAGDPRSELARALAEPTARFLDDIHESRPHADEEFVAFYERLALDALPVEAARVLSSLRARIARRHGEDYLPYYDAQGCVRDWTVGRMEGHLGELELSLREEDRSFTADPTATATHLSCAVRVWNPAPQAGIRRLRSVVEVGEDGLLLQLSGEHALRAYVDGVPVFRSDRVDRWPAREAQIEVDASPGSHVVEIRTVVPKERAWLLVRATGLTGRRLAVRPWVEGTAPGHAPAEDEIRDRAPQWPSTSRGIQRALRGSTYVPLQRYLALEQALATGDSDRAETLAGSLAGAADEFADALLLLAEFEKADPSRGQGASATRERKLLARAREIDPGLDRALLQLLVMDYQRGDLAEVVETLKGLPDGSLDHVPGQLLRWRVYSDRGNDFLAQKALDRARKLHPQGCEILLAQRQVASDRQQVRVEDEVVRSLAECAGTLGLQARWAARRGDRQLARQLWEEQLARIPDDVEAMEALAGLEADDGRFDEAVALLRRILALAPYHSVARISIADALSRAGRVEDARAEVAKALALIPQSSRLREIGESIGLSDPLMKWRFRGSEALAEYAAVDDEHRRIYEGVGEVMILDRDVAQVYADGSQRHVIHQMIHMLSKESLDRHGEWVPPEGAKLLTLHTIKPDGRIVEPEAIGGKEGHSLRELAPGDVLEFEFVVEQGPMELLPGYADLGRFRFQSLEVPFHRSELIVLHDPELAGVLRVESRNHPPSLRRRTVDGLGVMEFRADHVPRLGAEPNARSLLDEVPMVRIHTDLDPIDWVKSVTAGMRASQRSNPEMRRLVRELLAGVEDPRERLELLWNWCIDNVEDEGDMSVPATRTLAARQGNRLMLLRALLRVADIDSELWLARDAFGPTRPPGSPHLFETYEAPMLAVFLAGREAPPLMVLTSSRVLPLGYLTPGFSGTEAFRVQLADDDRPAAEVRLPLSPAHLADRREYLLEITLDAQGSGRLSGTLTLQGLEALQWRSVLEEIDRDRVEEVFQQAELPRVLPGTTLDLESLEIEHEDELESPLVLRFAASAVGAGARQGGELVLPSALVTMNQGRTFTVLPSRWSGLVIPYAPELRARVTLHLEGAAFTAVPGRATIDQKFGSYSRSIVSGGVREQALVLETRSTLRSGVVPAAEYPQLVEFTSELEDAEQSVLRAR